jgi:arginase
MAEPHDIGANGARRRVLAALAAAALLAFERPASAGTGRALEIIGAPSNLGLRPPRPGHEPGAWRAPQVWRELGLVERLGAKDLGDLERPAYHPEPDPVTGFRNGAGLPPFSRALADRIGESLDRAAFPLVLGGDCSVTLGSALALRRRGRHGLLFVDGHPDFYVATRPGPSTAAGVDLALATGRGPRELTDMEGLRPYIDAHDVAVVAHRDFSDEPGYSFAEFRASGARQWPLDPMRKAGVAATMRDVRAFLENPAWRGFWIHLDVDVLDPKVMPAVDSWDPGGLQFAELAVLLGAALASPRCVGMHVTIYDPELDPDRRCGRRLLDMLGNAFQQRSMR